jgi:ribulose-phosphate 3-epimerase
MSPKLAASILSADFGHLAEQVKLIEPHADLVHVDAMDSHFVPVLSVGPVVVASIRRSTSLPIHCHLQVSRPEVLLADFAEAGTDIATVHVEAVEEPSKLTAQAASLGMKAGLAVSPATPADRVFPHLEELDRVLVMSVQPGWAGQPFMDAVLPKIEAVRAEIERRGLEVDVEVDGGIDEGSGARCVAAGATVLAAASSIFKANDPAEAARRLASVSATQEG